MNRSIRRAREARARNRIAAIRSIRASVLMDVEDLRPMARSTVGHGHPRSRKARSDEERVAWGYKPVQPRHAAIAEQVA